MTYLKYVEEIDILNITLEPTEYAIKPQLKETIDYLPIYISISCLIILFICCCYYQRRRRA